MSVIVPPSPLTLITDGYGVAAPTSGMMIGVEFVYDSDRVALAVTPKVFVAVLDPSLTEMVIVDDPAWPGTPVTVTVRFEPVPPSTTLLSGTRVGFEELLVTVRLANGVSTSPIVNGTGPVAPPMVIVWSAMLETVGGSFTGLTVTTNVVLLLSRPSLTVTVIVAVPLWFVAGVTVTVRLAPLPPNTMLFVGTRVVLEEALFKTRLAAEVSASPTVKLSGPVIVSSLIV